TPTTPGDKEQEVRAAAWRQTIPAALRFSFGMRCRELGSSNRIQRQLGTAPGVWLVAHAAPRTTGSAHAVRRSDCWVLFWNWLDNPQLQQRLHARLRAVVAREGGLEAC